MTFRRTLTLSFCALAAVVLQPGEAAAVVLDWDTVYWADGSLSNTYQADPADPNSNVTITVASNNGANFVPYSGAPNPFTPTVNAAFQGGRPTIEKTLTLAVDLANAFESISLTVSFASSGGASDVSFTVFDIDGGGPYQDKLSGIQALSIDGTTLIAPTITTSLNNVLVGTGLNQMVLGTGITADTGPTSGRGNVTISFGTNVIQSLTFTYGSGPGYANPAYQHFGVHDISFTPVPEVNPAIVCALSCLAVSGLVLRKRLTGKGNPVSST